MIATVNKSIYGANRFRYVQPSPPPSHNGTGSTSLSTPDQSPLTLLVKACSDLDQLTSNIERKRLNSMVSLGKMDTHFSPSKRPRLDCNEENVYPIRQNAVPRRLDSLNPPDPRFCISTTQKNFDERKNVPHGNIYEPKPNVGVHHFDPSVKHKSFKKDPEKQKTHSELSIEDAHIPSHSCLSICGNQACSCKKTFKSTPNCAIPSPHNACPINSYDWSNLASNANHILPYPMPMYSPFLVPPTPSYTTPLSFGSLPSLGKSMVPFEFHGHCLNQNLPSNGVPYHPFPFIPTYYGTPTMGCHAQAATTSTVSTNLASLNNHPSTKLAKPSQFTHCAPLIEPTTKPVQMTSIPKMVPTHPYHPPQSPLTPWYMAAETSRMYYDYYYRIWLYNRSFNQLLNPNFNYPINEHYLNPSAPYGLNQNLQGWVELETPKLIPDNFIVDDIPSAVAHNG